MAGVVSHNCPHCGTVSVAVPILYQYVPGVPGGGFTYMCMGRCDVCHEPVTFKFKREQNARIPDPQSCSGDPRKNGWHLVQSWPDPKVSEMPQYLPPQIERIYKQGEDCIRAKAWDAAGSMYRKVIDISTVALNANPKKKLVARIDELAAQHAITPGLQTIAHKVRLDGNDAAHDEAPFSEQDALDIEFFTRMFLMYSFTLPGMLQPKLNENSG